MDIQVSSRQTSLQASYSPPTLNRLSSGPYMTCIKAFKAMTTLQPDGLTQEVNLVVIVKYDPVFITYGMAQL